MLMITVVKKEGGGSMRREVTQRTVLYPGEAGRRFKESKRWDVRMDAIHAVMRTLSDEVDGNWHKFRVAITETPESELVYRCEVTLTVDDCESNEVSEEIS